MRNILIAHNSEDFAHALYMKLRDEFQVTVCFDGNCALSLLHTLKPDILILDLMLPYKSGFAILEEAHPLIPPIVLATTSHNGDSVAQSPAAKYIDYIFLSTCAVDAVVNHIHLLASKLPPLHNLTPWESQAINLLLNFQIPPHLHGFQQLKVAIPLFAKDPAQGLSKEIYPVVAELCGFFNGERVERSIRTAIKSGWKTGDKDVWKKYFPKFIKKAPTNKAFLSCLSTFINMQK